MAAVALPIIIHLLFRRRAKREAFPSLEFLEQISQRQRRRIRLRHWILLALRVLIVALFAAAMMRPALPTAGSGGAGSTTGVIVFDNSFSMQATTEDGSLVEEARNRLAELGRLFGEGDRVQLVFPTSPPTNAFDGPVQSFDRVAASARNASVSYSPATHATTLEEAMHLAADAASLNREVYVISDFQEGDWSDASTLPDVPDGVRVYLVPVADDGIPNVAVSSASIVKASVQGGGSGAVRVTLANYSDGDLVAYPIRVFADEIVLAEGALAVSRDDYATIDLPLQQPIAAGATLHVRIPEDALAADDVAWLASEDREAIRVLIVHGADPDELTDEPFLRLALDPPGQVGERLFTVDELSLRDLPVQTDLDYDAFVLNNVGRVSEGSIARLRLAHRDGAGIIIFLGDRADLGYTNSHILPDFLDVTLEEPVSSEGGFFTLTPDVTGHPIFDGFKMEAGDALTAARFLKVVRSRVGSRGRVLASFGNLPALVEGDRSLLFMSSADLRWGNFPTGGSFLPFVHQAVMRVAASAVEARRFRAGLPITFTLPVETVSGEVVCLGPDGSSLPVHQHVQASRVEIRTDPVPEPGIYRFVAAGETLRRVAVQLDASESRLRYRDPAALVRVLGDRARLLEAGGSVVSRVMEDRHGREIWKELLIAALLLMAIESALGRVRVA